MENAGSAVWIVDTDGDTWQSGTATMTSLILGSTTLSEADLTDLTDGGQTSLHSHAVGGGDIKADGTVPMTADWPFGSYELRIGSETNSFTTVGITIQQGANDNDILAFKSSDVAHGITIYADTNTYAGFFKYSATQGGLKFRGYTEGSAGIEGQAMTTSNTTGKTKTDTAQIMFTGYKKSGADIGDNDAGANIFGLRGRNSAATQMVWVCSTEGNVHQYGPLFINDTANSKMTMGITINQGTADDEILAFKSDDVAHGMTTQAETDTFGRIKKVSNDYGGLRITGFSETGTTMGAILRGVVTDEETGKTSSDYGAVLISGATRSSATFGNMSADANIVAIANNGTTVWIVDADGDTWQTGSATLVDIRDKDGDTKVAVEESSDEDYIRMDVGGTEALVVTPSGEVQLPVQPFFYASMSTAVTNIPADATNRTVPFNTANVDPGSDFDTTNYRYVAPCDGYYYLMCHLRLEDVDASCNYYVFIIATSNKTHYHINDWDFASDPDYLMWGRSVVTYLDAGDYAYVQYQQSGGAAQTDIIATNAYTQFRGWLLG
jgi:hypothetical protein